MPGEGPRASWANLPASSPLNVIGGKNVASTLVSPGNIDTFGSVDNNGSGSLALLVANYAMLLNAGGGWDRQRNNSAGNISTATQPFAALGTAPGEWTLQVAANVNTQATITKAAGGAGVRHVLRSFMACLISNAIAGATPFFCVRDGASGAGTILFIGYMVLPAPALSESPPLMLSGLNIFGSANTAMTVEFQTSSGAGTFQSVSASGYSTI